LLGNAATEDKAEQLARNMQNCPYIALYIAQKSLITGVFVLPKEKRWWIEIPQERPELLGLEHLEIFFPEQLDVSSPWSRGAVHPTLSTAPCGSNCTTCPYYQAQCHGCPATIYNRSDHEIA
jgi:hypothetical protein